MNRGSATSTLGGLSIGAIFLLVGISDFCISPSKDNIQGIVLTATGAVSLLAGIYCLAKSCCLANASDCRNHPETRRLLNPHEDTYGATMRATTMADAAMQTDPYPGEDAPRQQGSPISFITEP